MKITVVEYLLLMIKTACFAIITMLIYPIDSKHKALVFKNSNQTNGIFPCYISFHELTVKLNENIYVYILVLFS